MDIQQISKYFQKFKQIVFNFMGNRAGKPNQQTIKKDRDRVNQTKAGPKNCKRNQRLNDTNQDFFDMLTKGQPLHGKGQPENKKQKHQGLLQSLDDLVIDIGFSKVCPALKTRNHGAGKKFAHQDKNEQHNGGDRHFADRHTKKITVPNCFKLVHQFTRTMIAV